MVTCGSERVNNIKPIGDEKKNISSKGCLVNSKPNSPNSHHKNCVADSNNLLELLISKRVTASEKLKKIAMKRLILSEVNFHLIENVLSQ